MPNYPLCRQRLIPIACCVLHNFIRREARRDRLFEEFQVEDLLTYLIRKELVLPNKFLISICHDRVWIKWARLGMTSLDECGWTIVIGDSCLSWTKLLLIDHVQNCDLLWDCQALHVTCIVCIYMYIYVYLVVLWLIFFLILNFGKNHPNIIWFDSDISFLFSIYLISSSHNWFILPNLLGIKVAKHVFEISDFWKTMKTAPPNTISKTLKTGNENWKLENESRK